MNALNLNMRSRTAVGTARLPRRHYTDAEHAIVARELANHYQIVRTLGRGGMGVVYLAQDIVLHRHVAIKVLRHDLLAHEDARERFVHEARLSAQLDHSGIVPLYALGQTPRFLYMVMRYIPGESLGDRLNREGRISPKETRAILTALARALDYAHKRGVVHRDLKPENVLLERGTGNVQLVDFGVAMWRSPHAVQSEVRDIFGTPHFMSPEQALGEGNLDGRSDIYGLGVLGYLMLSGTLPFQGNTFRVLTAKHLAEAAPSLAQLAPDAPRDLVAAIERCLAKDVVDRWDRASDLASALEPRRWSWGALLKRGQAWI